MSDINPRKDDRDYSPQESATRWEKELRASQKELSKWHEQGRRCNRKYLDVRDDFDQGAYKLNLFWSNVQVMMASLYSKPPRVDVSNTNKDQNDDVARVAGNILQRMLNHPLEEDDCDFDVATRQAIGDFLIVGLGQIWYLYEAEIEKGKTEPVLDAMGNEIEPAVEFEKVVEEDALSDYVFWEDFFWSPCRVWSECRWVARRVYMGQDQLVKRFGEIGKQVPISKQKKPVDSGQPQNDPWEKAAVFEIWDKTTKKVYWHALGMDRILDEKEDMLELEGFFPCPPPLIANLTTSNVMPRPDYVMGQDQYNQIDELTTRITYLTRACKMVGVYDKNSVAVGRVFEQGKENQMIPVDNWAAFAEKGGLKGQMDFIPIDMAAAIIEKLTAQREVISSKLYEVLGIGDIMRGMTNPDETLGAQQLKAQFGGSRLQHKQMQIGKWVAAGQRIRAQIICKLFQPETIKEQSNAMYSFDAPLVDQAIAFLKENNTQEYRVSIEAETMAMVDWAQERDARTQFMQAVGSFVQSVTPLIQAEPTSAPIVLQMMKWGLGGFRIGKEIETLLDQAIQAASQPRPPAQPSPVEQADVKEKLASADRQNAQAFQNRAGAVKDMVEAGSMNMDNKIKRGFMEFADDTGLPGQRPAPVDPNAMSMPQTPPVL